ncbi:MAG: response regulator transcription factor [Planctomycetes bacterium]|nr:response regulator transcription factor [Planctomycetota bacterium]
MTRWILVVEDETVLGEMVCDNLRQEGYEAELVGDGKRALERLARGGIDAVVLDIMLPGIGGFGVLETMRKRGDRTPVLILSARAADTDRIRGLELEADDYLTKPFHLRELLLRVGILLRRTPPQPAGSDVLEFGGNSVDFRTMAARTWQGREVELSPTELRLLRMLAARPGEVISRREIVETLFGPATPSTHRTIDNLVLALRKAFERDTKTPQHLHTVRAVGFRFTP